jgi:uncharacterized protein
MDLKRAGSREIEGLIEALQLNDLDKGLILTYDEEGEIEVEGRRIMIKPVWQWILEGRS